VPLIPRYFSLKATVISSLCNHTYPIIISSPWVTQLPLHSHKVCMRHGYFYHCSIFNHVSYLGIRRWYLAALTQCQNGAKPTSSCQ